MRAHFIQHVPFEGLGAIEPWLRSRGAEISSTRVFENADFPATSEIDWLIVMGGPMSVNDEQQLSWLVPEKKLIYQALAQSKTVLGVCLGAQLIANAAGCRVFPGEPEIGWHSLSPAAGSERSRFGSIFGESQLAFHWHGETFDLPSDAVHLARSAACEHQAFSLGDRVIGLQCHLEATPESVLALVENCGDELEPKPWIQTRPEILGKAEQFVAIQAMLGRLLERLAD
jgi:GMP synthase-like glutamine amidotransferase